MRRGNGRTQDVQKRVEAISGKILLVIICFSSQSLHPIRTVLMKAVRIFCELPNETIFDPTPERNASGL